MLTVDNIKVFNFEGALRGMRNPKESHHLSDSAFGIAAVDDIDYNDEAYGVIEKWVRTKSDAEIHSKEFEKLFREYDDWLVENAILINEVDAGAIKYAYIGPKDMKLAQTLIGAGTDHSKFMRQIFVSMDITAPLYWWKEFDTYKVGTVANSESTMHKLADTPITKECFSWDSYTDLPLIDPTGSPDVFFEMLISDLEQLRQLYKQTGEKRYWRALIQLLPNGWMQKRTVTLSYQTCRAMNLSREGHKLTEWHQLLNIFGSLPYADELIFYKKPKSVEENELRKTMHDILDLLEIPRVDENDKPVPTEKVMESFKEKINNLIKKQKGDYNDR